jgi:signal transduction histidine kinase
MSDEASHNLERRLIAVAVASHLRHELRNRLAGIRNAMFYIRRKVEPTSVFDDDPRVAKFFGLVDDEVERAMSVLDALRTGSETETTALPLHDLLDDVLADLPDGVEVHRMTTSARVLGDADALRLALSALVVNAVEATAAPGSVEIRTTDDGPWVVVEIMDRGSGLDAQQVHEAFVPLSTTKQGRAGMGLAVARQALAACGGELVLSGGPNGMRASARLRRDDST